VKASK